MRPVDEKEEECTPHSVRYAWMAPIADGKRGSRGWARGGVNGNDEAKGSVAHGNANARMGKTKRRMDAQLEIGLWQCGQMKMRSGWHWQILGFSVLEDGDRGRRTQDDENEGSGDMMLLKRTGIPWSWNLR